MNILELFDHVQTSYMFFKSYKNMSKAVGDKWSCSDMLF